MTAKHPLPSATAPVCGKRPEMLSTICHAGSKRFLGSKLTSATAIVELLLSVCMSHTDRMSLTAAAAARTQVHAHTHKSLKYLVVDGVIATAAFSVIPIHADLLLQFSLFCRKVNDVVGI